jgi:hypothetical protein
MPLEVEPLEQGMVAAAVAAVARRMAVARRTVAVARRTVAVARRTVAVAKRTVAVLGLETNAWALLPLATGSVSVRGK